MAASPYSCLKRRFTVGRGSNRSELLMVPTMPDMRKVCVLATLSLGLVLVACKKVDDKGVSIPAPQPAVTSNKNEPVIFNGQKFMVSFDYQPEAAAYAVAVRRMSSPLRDRENDRKDAEQVAKSTLTHYACPGSTKAKRIDDQAALGKNGEWKSWLRCS
jgi:hypothetical protein